MKKNWKREDLEEGFRLKTSASSHTHGVQPLGNLLLNPSSFNSRNTGLGNLCALSDELVLDVLGLLGATDLGVLSRVSKSLYIFSNHEPLGEIWHWRISKSCLCASLEMKPEWLERDNIQRRRGISVEDFVLNFEEPNKPVLLEGCLDNWAALEKRDRDYLIRVCEDVGFSVGPVEMKVGDYFWYSDNVKEERSLYLFDPKFADKVAVLGSDYEIPVYFREDLFTFGE